MAKYWIMDGRATTDVDSATVIESFAAKNDKAAKRYLSDCWQGYDYVVVKVSTQEIVW